MTELTSKEQAMLELKMLTYEFLLITRKLSLEDDLSDQSPDSFRCLFDEALATEIETRVYQTDGIDAITHALHNIYDRLNDLEERVRLSDN